MLNEKLYVLDTSVLVHDPEALRNFRDTSVAIPIFVVMELDDLKVSPRYEVASSARQASRRISDIVTLGDVNSPNGIKDPKTGSVFYMVGQETHFESIENTTISRKMDLMILGEALILQDRFVNMKVILVTKDVNLRILATAKGLRAEDYRKDRVDANDVPTGVHEVALTDPDALQSLYGREPPATVDGVDLSVDAGETVCVVGESGSGKTTLGLALLRLISSQGPIAYVGNRIDAFDSKAMRPLRREMQVVFQDPYGSLSPRMTVEEIIAEGLGVHGVDPGRNRREMVAEIMTEVGLDPAMMHRYPHEFSGGQRQRIAIARALMLKPSLVVADEPVSALDVSIQAQVLNLLADLQRELGLAYLFISHDLGVVRHIAHDVLVMYLGHTVEQGDKQTLFAQPLHPYTRALLDRHPAVDVVLLGRVQQLLQRHALRHCIRQHGGKVVVPPLDHRPSRCKTPLPTRPHADAVFTAVAGQKVGVVTADCLPILIASRDGRFMSVEMWGGGREGAAFDLTASDLGADPARLAIAHELGHGRPEVSNAYLGPSLAYTRSRQQAAAEPAAEQPAATA